MDFSALNMFKPFTDEVEGAVRIPTTGLEPGVNYIHDVEYADIDGNVLHLQILIPSNREEMMKRMMQRPDTKKYPCVVYTQGSAWFKQDCYARIPEIARLAERGYVVAIVEYRHSGIARFPAQAKDMRNAIRFLRKNADKYYIDPDKIIGAGNSSGGHTALFAGIIKDDDTKDNLYPGFSAYVKGIINYYGSTTFTFPDSNPVTMNHCKADSPEGLVMGGVDLNENPELIKAISVDCNIFPETDLPPVLNIHGTADVVVNCKCSVAVHNRLKECGKDSELILVEGAGHGGSEFSTKEVLDLVTRFIEKCLK
ncbi:MAG: alpha/beta hydrolase [Erysipelotrichaceae bacterium]|nr:alpha/beta hydrolase [Erysipelotrichaceae bacterium]